ncbi:MAG: MFS transporter [Novosphingobium sp.]
MSDNRFMARFVALSLVSGLTVGLGKVVTTLFAIQLDATPFQIGLVSAMESVGMILVTVPAGFLIARHGARSIYFASSMGPLAINLLLPLSASWIALAAGRWAIGLCIPFRLVAMNGAFLERLRSAGDARGGWYRGSLTAGVSILGPAVASLLTSRAGAAAGFYIVAALFGIMAVFSLSFMPARDVAAPAEAHRLLSGLGELLRDPVVADCCLVEFLSGATTSLFATFIILLALDLPPLTETDGINAMLAQGAAAVAMLFAGGAFVNRLSREASYAFALALAAAALLALGFATVLPGLLMGGFLLSAGVAIAHLVNVRMLASLPGAKSKAAGLFNLATMTGGSVGAIGGGLLTKLVPLQSVFLLWLPLLVLGALFVTLIRRKAPQLALRDS